MTPSCCCRLPPPSGRGFGRRCGRCSAPSRSKPCRRRTGASTSTRSRPSAPRSGFCGLFPPEEHTVTQLVTSQECARLASDLDRGVPLPASWYTDPAILTLEHERIFRRAWQYVGRTEQLTRTGDCITGEADGV